MSSRKPYNDRAGYVASLRSGKGGGWVVIYEAEAAGIDTGTRYAVSCEQHGSVVGETSVPKARRAMKAPQNFCEECRARGAAVKLTPPPDLAPGLGCFPMDGETEQYAINQRWLRGEISTEAHDAGRWSC